MKSSKSITSWAIVAVMLPTCSALGAIAASPQDATIPQRQTIPQDTTIPQRAIRPQDTVNSNEATVSQHLTISEKATIQQDSTNPQDVTDTRQAERALEDQLNQTQDIEPIQQPEPPEQIDKERVGWFEAGTGTDGERVGSRLRASWVMIDETDGLTGQVINNFGEMSIFLIRNGFVVGEFRSTEFGSFQIEGLSPGPYTLVGHSPGSIFAFGFIALEHNPESTAGVLRVIRPQAVSGIENVQLIGKIIETSSPLVNFRTYGVYDVGEGEEDPPQYFGMAGLAHLSQPTTPATTINTQPISLQSGGRFVGRIHQIDTRTGRPVEVLNTQITIIQNGEIILETQTDSLGIFGVEGLIPGSYGIVASGSDGFGTIGIDLVAAPTTPTPDGDTRRELDTRSFQPVAYRKRQDSGPIDLLLVDPESIGWLNKFIQEELYQQIMQRPRPGVGDQIPFNMPYDYFSAGGGFSTGGPFSTWLYPIGIAAIIASGDNNETSGGVNFVSPFFP